MFLLLSERIGGEVEPERRAISYDVAGQMVKGSGSGVVSAAFGACIRIRWWTGTFGLGRHIDIPRSSAAASLQTCARRDGRRRALCGTAYECTA